MLPNNINRKLWVPQKEGFKKMATYLKSFQKKETSKAALIHIPTGAGKTGLVACLCHFGENVGHVVVVTPRLFLTNQISDEIRGGFFTKIEYPGTLPKKVVLVQAGDDFPDRIMGGPTIFVTTIQKLSTFVKTAKFDPFCKKIDLLVFDEGHYQPAPRWVETVNRFDCPRIIVTATPFRNDFKSFNVDREHIYTFPFFRAVEQNLLRTVVIASKKPIGVAEAFVDDVLHQRDKLTESDDDSRVIIRCESEGHIRQIASALDAKGEKFVAIHENFVEGGPDAWEHKRVPDPSSTDARIWVHQKKLLEGVDDPRFRILATFDPFVDTRSLIQQIGRIVRNPGLEKDQKAFFWDYSDGKQAELWNEYLSYDTTLTSDISAPVGEKIGAAISDLPPIEYVNGRFRDLFDPGDSIANVIEEVNFPLSCNLIILNDGYEREKVCETIEIRLRKVDSTFRRHDIDENTSVYVYVSFKNSRFLSRKYFIDSELNVCVFRKLDSGYLAFFDSTGFVLKNDSSLGLGKPVEPRILKRLISNKDGSKVIDVSLKNSDFGRRSIRSRSLSAHSIEETTPFLDDHANVLSTMTGFSWEDSHPLKADKGTVRRYVGIGNGRLTEDIRPASASDFFKWLNYIDGLLGDKRRKPVSVMARYGSELEEVKDKDPVHILLDLSTPELGVIKDSRDAGKDVQFEDLSCKIKKAGTKFTFILKESGEENVIDIRFDDRKGRYFISSSQLASKYANEDGEDLARLINKHEPFRVVPKQSNTIYVDGRFYSPAIKFGSKFDQDHFHVGRVIKTDDFLEKNGSEKGAACKPDESGWDDASVFGLIDSLGKGTSLEGLFGTPDLLICDDLGTEIADFVLADEDRVIFMHAKGNTDTYKKPCSASALQDVCGQATKNIQFLSMFNEHKPKHLDRWSTSWKREGIGTVSKRIRKGTGTPDEIWTKLSGRINEPEVSREVWLVLGRILSKKEFLKRLSKNKPEPEAVQAAIFLHATMTSVYSIGAKLRILCYP